MQNHHWNNITYFFNFLQNNPLGVAIASAIIGAIGVPFTPSSGIH